MFLQSGGLQKQMPVPACGGRMLSFFKMGQWVYQHLVSVILKKYIDFFHLLKTHMKIQLSGS